mgnify:CR=1 FL=1
MVRSDHKAFLGYKIPIVNVTDHIYITKEQSGTLFTLSAPQGNNMFLPTPAAGLNYSFVITITPIGGSNSIISTSNGVDAVGLMFGNGHSAGGNATETAVGDLELAQLGPIGSHMRVECDGTKWYIFISAPLAANIVIQ